MTNDVYAHERRGIAARLSDWTAGGREMARTALRETMTWSAYQWTVLALLTAIFILLALSYGAVRTELAALKQNDAGAPDQSLVMLRADLEKRISEMQAGLTQSMAEMKSGLDASLAKIGAKLDVRSQAPKPATKPPAPKPRP